jgi:hypothetical protein
MTVARELAKYKLDLVGVQGVTRDKDGTVRAGECTFSMAKGRKIINWGHVFFCAPENSISNQESGVR